MRRVFFFFSLLLFSSLCFAQQSSTLRIIGRIPGAEDNRVYQIQVGAFKVVQNAERAFGRLNSASITPAYERYLDFTRVVVNGIAAVDVPRYLQRLQSAGFSEVIIRIDTGRQTTAQTPGSAPQIGSAEMSTSAEMSSSAELSPTPPVSNAMVPSAALSEVGYRTIKAGETLNLMDIAGGRDVTSWTSSTPSVVSVDSNGSVTGQNIGNAYIKINDSEYISVVIVPQEDFYVVPESQVALLPQESNTGELSIESMTEYRTEPTFRLSYRFANKGENRGASGENGGIDILARGENYQWLWTTFYQGGWFYDLNGTKREMVNGFQKDADNGVELTIKPEFIYDRGVPYLQLIHRLRNPNSFPVTGQKFGASADVMIHQNDFAFLMHTPYGAHMTDLPDNPSLELMFVCESGDGITPVDTLWLGAYDEGHLDYIYDDRRNNVYGLDSAIGFSYQNIELAAGETKEFTVRFTLARNED